MTWIQRTTVHLEEMYAFFRGVDHELPLLDPKQLAKHRVSLNIASTVLAERNDFDMLVAKVGDQFEFSAVEDGVFTLRYTSPIQKITTARKHIEAYYRDRLGPALAYLYHRGAPLPKELHTLTSIYPIIIIVSDASEKDVIRLYRTLKEDYDTIVSSKTTQFFFGPIVTIIRKTGRDEGRDRVFEQLLSNIVFLREYYRQLHEYINLHRTIWDQISAIRESTHIRYRDFPTIRLKLMDFLKTLFFIKARLHQMGDIVAARKVLLPENVKKELEECGLYRFESALTDERYLMDLWNMTIEYAQGTSHLLESLFQENTQRELNALKFITLIGAITSFFGMNIAFPWEERWPAIFESSIVVVGIITLVSFAFYLFLRILIYNRQFRIGKRL